MPCLSIVRRFLSANSAPTVGTAASGGTMNIHLRTHGDVLRYTTTNVVVTATWTLAIMVAAILLELGTDLTTTVRTNEIVGFILVAAVMISALLSGVLSWRSALLLRQMSLMGSELARVSETDHLTGLLNRRGFDDAAAKALKSTSHVGAPTTVLMCDIDHFKSINDRFGHEGGDKVLVEVADLLRRFAYSKGGLVARHGGEEFAVMLIGIGHDEADQWAEEVRSACAARKITVGAAEEQVTMSIGFTVATGGTIDFAEMMRIADRALYVAKNRGRNRVAYEASPSQSSPKPRPDSECLEVFGCTGGACARCCQQGKSPRLH